MHYSVPNYCKKLAERNIGRRHSRGNSWTVEWRKDLNKILNRAQLEVGNIELAAALDIELDNPAVEDNLVAVDNLDNSAADSPEVGNIAAAVDRMADDSNNPAQLSHSHFCYSAC